MVERVIDTAGETAIASVEGRRLGDRPESQQRVLGGDGQRDADVAAAMAGRRFTRPGTGDEQGGARGQADVQGLFDATVRGMAQAEVIGGDDDRLGLLSESESPGQLRHQADPSARVAS